MCCWLIAQGLGWGCVLAQTSADKATRDYTTANNPTPTGSSLCYTETPVTVQSNNFLLESIIHTNLTLNYPCFLVKDFLAMAAFSS